jgi:hypothetical protein
VGNVSRGGRIGNTPCDEAASCRGGLATAALGGERKRLARAASSCAEQTVAPGSASTEDLELIKTYGLHWHNDKVFWGRQKVSGTLLGATSKNKSAKAVDFRLQRGIYALYANYELVYVGQTGSGDDRLLKRLRTHNRDHLSERWNRFSWIGTQWVTQKGVLSADTAKLLGDVSQVLNVVEAVATAIAEPRLNLQRGKWSAATQYYQYIPHQEDKED